MFSGDGSWLIFFSAGGFGENDGCDTSTVLMLKK